MQMVSRKVTYPPDLPRWCKRTRQRRWKCKQTQCSVEWHFTTVFTKSKSGFDVESKNFATTQRATLPLRTVNNNQHTNNGQ